MMKLLIQFARLQRQDAAGKDTVNKLFVFRAVKKRDGWLSARRPTGKDEEQEPSSMGSGDTRRKSVPGGPPQAAGTPESVRRGPGSLSPGNDRFMELCRSGSLALIIRRLSLWVLAALMFTFFPVSFALLSSCGGDPSKSSAENESRNTVEDGTKVIGPSGSEESDPSRDYGHHQKDGHGAKDSHGSHEGHDDHGAHGSSRNTGPDMAVLEAHKTKGIRLARSTIDTCEIGFSAIGAYNAKNIPPSSRIRTGEAILVYVMADNYIYPVLMSGTLKGEEISAIRARDKVDFSRVRLVVQNSDIVHLALLEAFGASGSGHGH